MDKSLEFLKKIYQYQKFWANRKFKFVFSTIEKGGFTYTISKDMVIKLNYNLALPVSFKSATNEKWSEA